MIKQVFISGDYNHATTNIRAFLETGWRVVPGTIVFHSHRWAPDPRRGCDRLTDGSAFELYLAVTLEREEKQPRTKE